MTAGSGSIKQFWFREGSANSNDFEIYVRTLAGTWSNWRQIIVEVEKGSNNNGNYIKYSDGTMICSNKITRTVNITNSYEGSYYANVQGIYFPKSFTSAPTITATATTQSSLVAFNFSSVSNDSCNGYVWKSQSKSSVSMDLSYNAIGRWK